MLLSEDITVLSKVRKMEQGTKRPLLATCAIRSAQGDQEFIDFVLKPTGSNMTACQVYTEAVSGSIAYACGLHTPRCAVIHLDASTATLLSSPERLVDPGPCFASEYVSETVELSGSEKAFEHQTVKIFLFDYFLQNRDRLGWNPNTLMTSDGLILIDHEQALDFACLGGEPDKPEFFLTSTAVNAHFGVKIMKTYVRDHTIPDLRGLFSQMISNVTPSLIKRVAEICGQTPETSMRWSAVDAHLLDLQQNIDVHVGAIHTHFS